MIIAVSIIATMILMKLLFILIVTKYEKTLKDCEDE